MTCRNDPSEGGLSNDIFCPNTKNQWLKLHLKEPSNGLPTNTFTSPTRRARNVLGRFLPKDTIMEGAIVVLRHYDLRTRNNVKSMPFSFRRVSPLFVTNTVTWGDSFGMASHLQVRFRKGTFQDNNGTIKELVHRRFPIFSIFKAFCFVFMGTPSLPVKPCVRNKGHPKLSRVCLRPSKGTLTAPMFTNIVHLPIRNRFQAIATMVAKDNCFNPNGWVAYVAQDSYKGGNKFVRKVPLRKLNLSGEHWNGDKAREGGGATRARVARQGFVFSRGGDYFHCSTGKHANVPLRTGWTLTSNAICSPG